MDSTTRLSLFDRLVLISFSALTTVMWWGCSEKIDRRTTEPNLLSYSRIPEAQNLSRGDGVIVAVLDWQFDMSPDQAAKYVDPVCLVPGEKIGDLKPWHGEWMACIVHEIAPGVKIIPIQCRGMSDDHYQKYLIQGIYYAADHGAVAVSSSMGPTRQSDDLRAAIDYAEQKGTVFVDVHPETVVGADGKPRLCDAGECDPRIIHTGVISVREHPVEPEPNRDVYTWPYDLEAKYEDGWGYSNAPPVIMGAIALMKSLNPRLTPDQVRDIIRSTALQRDGFAVLDALGAVSAAGVSAKR